MARSPLYAQFASINIDGTFYGLGDEIGDHDRGTLDYLESIGQISGNRPVAAFVTPVAVEKPTDEMSRAELEQTTLSLVAARMSDASDDDLRKGIDSARDRQPDPAADAGSEKPLAQQNTAELNATAEREGVDLSSASKNSERVDLITKAREAKAQG